MTVEFIRRGYGTTCTACGATVLNLDAQRHRAWHNKIARQLKQAGTSHDQEGTPSRRSDSP